MRLWVKNRVFDKCAHSKAVLDDSLITVDTTSLDESASKEVTRATLFLVLCYPWLLLVQWLFPYQ